MLKLQKLSERNSWSFLGTTCNLIMYLVELSGIPALVSIEFSYVLIIFITVFQKYNFTEKYNTKLCKPK